MITSEKSRRRLGKSQQKILLLLFAGLTLGLSRSPGAPFRIARAVVKEWREIDRGSLTRGVRTLYRSKLVSEKKHPDGSLTLVLTEAGKRRALRYNLETMRIARPRAWDGRWRVVMYDVPEALRDLRIDLFATLKRLGFFELQHSVFIHPFECKNEIEFLIEAYDARDYVRRMTVEEIDSPEPVMKYFRHLGIR